MVLRTKASLAASTRLAAKQYGVISRAQALARGLSPDEIQRLVDEGLWARVRPSVFALWRPSHAEGIWRQRLSAGTLWLGPASAISHRASAMLRKLDGIDSGPVEFSTTTRRRSAEPGLVIHRVRCLSPKEIETVEGLTVTTVPRTLIDLASLVPASSVELALESALRRGLASREQVEAALEASAATQPGRGILRALLRERPAAATESALETLVWRLMKRWGLPEPIRQFEIHDGRGKFVARVDFAYPDAMLVIEADGFGPHSKPRDLQRDRRRQNAVTRLGWAFYRTTWDDVTRRGTEVAGEIAALYASRRVPLAKE